MVAWAMALGTTREGSLASSAILGWEEEKGCVRGFLFMLEGRTYRAVLSALVMIQAGVRHPKRKAKPGGLQPDEGWKSVKA